MTKLDWPSNRVYLQAWREALIEHHWPRATSAYFATENVLAWPYPLLGPATWLSPRLSDRAVFTLYWLTGYVLGFFGAVKLFPASIIAGPINTLNRIAVSAHFAIFWFLFNFNGYMVGHLLAGHIQLVGYFGIPWFFYAVRRML
jgi:hypothetical protein